MSNEQQKIQRLLDMNQEIEQARDVDLVLERILSVARRLINADAGSIYVVDGENLRFNDSQNDTLQHQQADPSRKLIYKTFTVPINHQSISGYVASTGEMLNIPDVYRLAAQRVPYSFDPSYDRKSNYISRSMLTIPLKNNQNKVIGVMQLINAKNEQGDITAFLAEDIPLIKIFANYAAMALERAQMTRTIILRMISMAELRDPEETGTHVNRVGAYSAEIYDCWARQRNLPEREITNYKDILRMAAMLHDVGKVGIEDEILRKPGRLDEQQYETMKQHVLMGARLFLNPQSDFDAIAGLIALSHHERWDGTGYPGHVDIKTGQALPEYLNEHGQARGKKGEEISIFGRIVAVADVYDALSTKRTYKDAWDEDDVLNELRKGSGNHFDPEVIDAFFARLEMIRAIAQRYSENHRADE